jgi:hypothetical protein
MSGDYAFQANSDGMRFEYCAAHTGHTAFRMVSRDKQAVIGCVTAGVTTDLSISGATNLKLDNNSFGAKTLNSYAVSAVPSASLYSGGLIHCTNGDAGNPCLAVSDGTNWKRVALGATISAS